MKTRGQRSWSLAGLADATGASPRTIRFYIARGLLPPPRTRGRHAAYDAEHVERLARVHELRQRGLTLTEIQAALAVPAGAAPAPKPVACWQHTLCEGVTVQVRADLPPWRLHHIQRQLAALAQALSTDPHSHKEEAT